MGSKPPKRELERDGVSSALHSEPGFGSPNRTVTGGGQKFDKPKSILFRFGSVLNLGGKSE